MKALVTISCILLSLLLKAQDSAAVTAATRTGSTFSKRIPKGHYLIVYAEPAALLDFSNGSSCRFGAEYVLRHNWAVYGTYGRYFQQGYILRAGVKRYLWQEENKRYALGIEYINNWHIFTTQDYYKKPDSLQGSAPDMSRPVSLTAEKYINAIAVIYSYEEFWRHHWMIEIYAGAGIRFKHILTNIPETEEDNLYHYHESMIENIGFTPGKFTVPDIRIGFKIGRVFVAGKRSQRGR